MTTRTSSPTATDSGPEKANPAMVIVASAAAVDDGSAGALVEVVASLEPPLHAATAVRRTSNQGSFDLCVTFPLRKGVADGSQASVGPASP